MSWLTNLLTGVPPAAVYATVAVVVFSETAVIAGIVVPTLSTLLLVGFLCSSGTLDLRVALLVAVAAALAGDHVAYWTGVRQGGRIRSSALGRRLGAARWQRADQLLARLGGRATFVGRYITVVRTLVPQLCGAARVPYPKFALWNLPGVVGWAGIEVTAGYLAGASYQEVAGSFGEATAAAALLAVVFAGAVVAARWLSRNPDPVGGAARTILGSELGRQWWGRHGERVARLRDRLGPRVVTALTLAAGLGMLFVVTWILVSLARIAVHFSGLKGQDRAIAGWLAAQDDYTRVGSVIAITSALGNFALVAAAFIVTLIATVRRLRRRPTLLDVLRAAGPFVPLAVLAQLTGWLFLPVGPEGVATNNDSVFAAVIVLTAWSATRDGGRIRSVVIWTLGAAVLAVIIASRLIIGWVWLSDALTSVIIGASWSIAMITVVRYRERRRTPPGPAAPD